MAGSLTASTSMPAAWACFSAAAPDIGPAETRLEPMADAPASASAPATTTTTIRTKSGRDARVQHCRIVISLPPVPREEGRLLLYTRARGEETGQLSPGPARGLLRSHHPTDRQRLQGPLQDVLVARPEREIHRCVTAQHAAFLQRLPRTRSRRALLAPRSWRSRTPPSRPDPSARSGAPFPRRRGARPLVWALSPRWLPRQRRDRFRSRGAAWSARTAEAPRERSLRRVDRPRGRARRPGCTSPWPR